MIRTTRPARSQRFAPGAFVLALLAAPVAAQQADDARAKRMAEDRVRYEALVAAIDRFGHLELVRSRLGKLLGAAEDRWIEVRDGYLVDISCTRWLAWNVVRDGKVTYPELGADGHHFDAIVDANRQLRARGIDFLLVTFPTRVELYPELYLDLPSVDGFAGFCPATARFALALIDAGVEVQYLAPEFVAARHDPDPELGALYLQDNMCWTPRAAVLAAKLVSDRVRRFPWFEQGAADSKTPYLGKSKEGEAWILREDLRDVAVVWGGLPFETKRERFRVTRVLHPELRKVDFAHPSSPITLLSDEFAFFHNVNDCDFAKQLFRHLETPIDAIHPFRGVEEGCRELADRSERSKAKKELVIWMIPEHAFRPRPGWRKIDLFPPDSRPRRGR